MSSDKKPRGISVTHYQYEEVNGPGQLVTRHHNQKGNPFVVFCTNLECDHYIEDMRAFPHWSEDCRAVAGSRFLRCPVCFEKVIRPRD